MVSRWRWLLVGAIGVLGGAVIAVLGFTVLPRAATVVLLGLAGAGFLAFEAATRTAGRGRERVEVPRNLVMADNDRLPLVRELNDPLVLGVHPAPAPDGERARGGAANAMPPFVDRNVAAELNEALRNDSFVLLVGESVSGKSRLAYEAMRSQLPNHVFVMAGSRAGLETVEQALEANEHCVVWLNDLDRFLGPYGLTPGQVARWRSRGERSVVLLATMQSRQYEEYLARASQAGEPGQAGHGLQLDGLAVLEMARVIPVARDWTDEERSKARQIDDPRIARALQHADKFGLAEHMVAAPQLYEDWKAAWAPGVHPRGAALVAAAIDARRCGWLRPVPRTLLERLHEGYLQRRGGNALRPETIEAALEWAVRSHRGTDSLLIPVGDGRVPEGEYLVFDYLPERLEAERVEIPAQLWRELIQAAEPAEAWDIGQAAYRRREYGWAQQAFAKAGRDGDHTALLAQARAIGRSGRMKEAVELLRGNLSRSGLRLGENHPDAPRTRYELLLWQTKEFELASGPDDPYTLASRHELAVCAAQAGHVREALEELGSLVLDRTRVLGAEHPDTLASRHEFAEQTGYAGDAAQAVVLFADVIVDRERTLGIDALDTLRSRARQAWWIGRAGRPAEAVDLLSRVRDDLNEQYGRDERMTMATLHELAYWTGHAGDPRLAERIFDEVVRDRTRVLGPDDPDTLASRSNHARWVGEAGRPARAVELFDLVIADRERVLGPDHPDTLWSRHRRAYWAAEAHAPSEAVRVLSTLVADRERVLGKDHPDTYDSAHQLARWVARTGDPYTAVGMLTEVLEGRTRLLGADHPETLSTRHRLAVCTGLAGDRLGALRMLHLVVVDRERVLGDSHPETLSTRHKIAYWTAMNGDVRGAIEQFESVAEDREQLLGGNHFSTLQTRHELAYWTKMSGHWQEAAELFDHVVRERSSALGADHKSTLESMHAQAHCTAESGDVAGAVTRFRRVVNDRRRTLGPDHPDTLTSLHELAYWTHRLGEDETAKRLFETVVAGRRRVLGADDPLTLDSRFTLVRITTPENDAELTHLLSQMFKAQRTTLAPDHPDVLRTRQRMALLVREPREALEQVEAVAEQYVRSLGPRHPDTLLCQSYLSARIWRTGDHRAAVALLEQVVSIRTEVLGAEHPATVDSRRRLENCLAAIELEAPHPDRMCRVYVEFEGEYPPVTGRDETISVYVLAGPEHPWSEAGAVRPVLEVLATPLDHAEVVPALAVCTESLPARFGFVARRPGEHRVCFTVYAQETGTALQEVVSEFTVLAPAPVPHGVA